MMGVLLGPRLPWFCSESNPDSAQGTIYDVCDQNRVSLQRKMSNPLYDLRHYILRMGELAQQYKHMFCMYKAQILSQHMTPCALLVSTPKDRAGNNP